MELGFTLDRSHGATYSGQWVNGIPKRNWLASWLDIGMCQLPPAKERITIGTFRCQSCGFLESYACDEFKPT